MSTNADIQHHRMVEVLAKTRAMRRQYKRITEDPEKLQQAMAASDNPVNCIVKFSNKIHRRVAGRARLYGQYSGGTECKINQGMCMQVDVNQAKFEKACYLNAGSEDRFAKDSAGAYTNDAMQLMFQGWVLAITAMRGSIEDLEGQLGPLLEGK